MATKLPVYHASLLMKIADPMGNLEDHMARKVLAEIRELNNLMKQFTAVHDWSEMRCSK